MTVPAVDQKRGGAGGGVTVADSNRRRLTFTFDASLIAVAHTYLALAGFFTALCIGCALHYKKIVKNGVAGYPQEWFPSVSATIGDWYPERNIFQIFIALNSGPRFVLVFLQYYLTRSPSIWPTIIFITGIIRTFSCGGWVYITSTDDHDWHDILMITYIVCNLPWMVGGTLCTPKENVLSRRRRRTFASAFFGSMIPMIYFFIQHKVHRIPGAYTRYSFFEWGLIILDVLYDSVVALDLKAANLQISLNASVADAHGGEHTDHRHNNNKITGQPFTANGVSALTAQEFAEASTHEIDVAETHGGNASGSWRSFLTFVSDVYLSYVSWSIYTSLAPTLFYFSVWELGIAGSELALLSLLSPFLLGITPLRNWAHTHAGRTVLHLLSFVGLAAYKLESPLTRLFAVAFANVVLCIGKAVDWTGGGDQNEVAYQGILMGLGLVMSSLSKHANHSNNPIWPIVNEKSGGYNKTGLFLALLALAEYASRPTVPIEKSVKQAQKEKTLETPAPSGSWLRASLSLGGLIFTLALLLTDSSTLIAWSSTGYPIKGPLPNMHGALTLIAQSIGLLGPITLARYSPSGLRLLSHPVWFIYGAASAYVMYSYRDWLGYVGGLNLAVFLMSIIPDVLQQSAAHTEKMGRVYFTAWLVVCMFKLANVWTVAYAFVPGGVYLRERTDLVLIAQMACLALAFDWPKLPRATYSVCLPVSTASRTRSSLALLSVMALLVTLYRLPSQSPIPHKAGARIVTAGIWTVHFGIDNEGRDSQRRMRDLIKDMQLDVVGLLETDLHRIVFGNRDLTRVIAEELGYYVDLGPGPNSHTWGAVLLSKYPIINSTHHLLPSPHGELAPAIEAVLDIYGTPVTVIVAHNGQEEDSLDRRLQSQELARFMTEIYPQPVIFLGYVVTKPHASIPNPYEILVSGGRVHDIDEMDQDRWCEYILYRGLYRTAYARVSRSTITDTELQIGQFVVPKYGYGVSNSTPTARYLRCWKEDLPPDHWMPMEYYGNARHGGVRGHFYHVFNTPLYYKLPEGAIV